MNSLIGPPTNLAMTPDERLAIVANSLDWVQDGASWKQVPDNKVFVIDLKMTPPVHAATLEVGRQPSGVAINRLGDLALVANRVDKSISVLSIQGREVKVVGTVTVGDEVVAVAFTPDGKRALAVWVATENAVDDLLRGTFGPSGTAQRERPRLPTSLAPHRVSDPFDRLHALGQDDPAAREGCAEASSSGAEEDPEGGLDELMLPHREPAHKQDRDPHVSAWSPRCTPSFRRRLWRKADSR